MADLSSAQAYALDPGAYTVGSEADYVNKANGYDSYGLFGHITSSLSGGKEKAQLGYQNAQTILDRKYEQDSLAAARAWEEYFDSTKYQRASKDLEAAGLNPWLAVQSGISGSGSSSTGASARGSTKNDSTYSKKSKNGSNLSSVITSAIKTVAFLAMLG